MTKSKKLSTRRKAAKRHRRQLGAGIGAELLRSMTPKKGERW